MLNEFRKFALRGNALDLAIGIIIGAAFTAIVQSLVDDVLMPPLGVILGGIDFSDYYIQLTQRDRIYPSLQAAREAGAAVIAYGNFVNQIVKFIIVAFALFLVIRQVNRLTALVDRGSPEAPSPPRDVVLLTEIRDILREKPAS
jgi:large conductance mechanosensitive channel